MRKTAHHCDFWRRNSSYFSHFLPLDQIISLFSLHTEKPFLISTTQSKKNYVNDCIESNLPCVSPPSFPPFLAATDCHAGTPGQCARLIFTTVPKSASASPTTWGLGGINSSPAYTEKRKTRTSFMTIQRDLTELKTREENKTEKEYMSWITASWRVFISAVCALTPARPDKWHAWSKKNTPKSKEQRDLCGIPGALTHSRKV